MNSQMCLFAMLLGAASDQGAPIERIRARVPVTAVEAGKELVAGKYVRNGFLAGADLHLFPDSTYIYCEWSDVSALTVYDKGQWKWSDASLTLSSDPVIRWAPSAEREYVLVRRNSHPTELLLVGTGQALRIFEQLAGREPEDTLAAAAFVRTQEYGAAKAPRIKAALMRDAWRPEHFGGGQ